MNLYNIALIMNRIYRIILGLCFSIGLTACFDLDKTPEGVLSTSEPFMSAGEIRNYMDQFYQTGDPKYYDSNNNGVYFGDGLRSQGFDAGGGQYIAGADTYSDNMSSSAVNTRLAGELSLSSATALTNYTAIRNLNYLLTHADACPDKGSDAYNQYIGEAYYFRA